MKITGRQMRQGVELPRGYALSHRLCNQDAALYYRFPLNLLVRWSMYAWWKVAG